MVDRHPVGRKKHEWSKTTLPTITPPPPVCTTSRMIPGQQNHRITITTRVLVTGPQAKSPKTDKSELVRLASAILRWSWLIVQRSTLGRIYKANLRNCWEVKSVGGGSTAVFTALRLYYYANCVKRFLSKPARALLNWFDFDSAHHAPTLYLDMPIPAMLA